MLGLKAPPEGDEQPRMRLKFEAYSPASITSQEMPEQYQAMVSCPTK